MWTYLKIHFTLISKRKNGQPFLICSLKFAKVFVQNGSLEISKIGVIKNDKTIGKKLFHFTNKRGI